MRRKQNIQDAFKSVVPEYAAGVWSVGYSGHTDNSALLSGGTIAVTAISGITDKFVPGTTDLVMNDVYVYYDVMAGTPPAPISSGKTSIYNYPTTTTTTTAAPTTTTTTAAPTTTTTTT